MEFLEEERRELCCMVGHRDIAAPREDTDVPLLVSEVMVQEVCTVLVRDRMTN